MTKLSATATANQKASSIAYFLVVLLAVLFTWILHEFAHWLVSVWLGNETVLTLNSAYPSSGSYQEPWHWVLITAAGPLVTLLQALAVFGHLMYRGWFRYFYPFLFVPFYMRLLAAFMNFIHLNDEGRISNYLHIGTFTLPLIVSAALLWMVYAVSKKYGLGWKYQLMTLLMVMMVSSVLILADQFWQIRLM